MSLDFSYWNKLPAEEQNKINKEVAKNRLKLKWAIFPLFFQVPTIPLSSVPFFPVEDFSPQQIVKNVKDEAHWTGDPWNNQEDE